MQRFFLCFILISTFFVSFVSAQSHAVKGTVVDTISGETLIGATVRVTDAIGAVTDGNGAFSFSLPPGTYTIHVMYVGYVAQDKEVKVDGKDVTVNFGLHVQQLQEVNIVSDVVTSRDNPVAFSQLNTREIEELRSQEDLPTLLNETPGVFATRQGGGFGDERITIRGVDQTNIGVLVDGLPVNDMESGQVYWSNWLGLGDATQSIQVQRGLGASKLAISSVGGTMNITTRGIQSLPEVRYRQEVGDDGYLKESVFFTTGKMKNGWGITGQGSRVNGNGWTDETWIKQWSFFLKVEKLIGHHILSLSAVGTSQTHGQQLIQQNISTYSNKYAASVGDTLKDKQRGLQYNQDWGYIDRFTVVKPGDTIHNKSILNAKVNQSFSPLYEFRDLWTINSKMFWSNVLYAETTNAGLTLPNNNSPATDANGQDIWQTAYNFNKYSPFSINKLYSPTLHEASYNYLYTEETNHVWYGLLSTFNWNINNHFSYTGGLDARTYTGSHYDQVADLLGGDYIAETTNEDENQSSPIKKVGDKVLDDYESHIRWGGIFNQLQYHKKRWHIFGTVNLSDEGFQREDFFKKKDIVLPDTTLLQAVGDGSPITYKGVTYTNQSPQARYSETPWKWIFQYTFKGGINYNVTEHDNIFANAGIFSAAPHFVDIFSSYNQPFVSVSNQLIKSVEGGYGLVYPRWDANINAYYTLWDNQPQTTTAVPFDGQDENIEIPNINVLLKGIEFNAKYRLGHLTFNVVGSLGDFHYVSSDSIRIYDNAGNIIYRSYFNGKGLPVGNAAQDQVGAGARYEFFKQHFFVRALYIYYAKDYAYYYPTDNNSASVVPTYPWRLPNFGLLSLYAGYKFKLYKKLNLALEGRVQNVLNTPYIADATNGATNNANTALVFMGRGRTYTTTLIITFR